MRRAQGGADSTRLAHRTTYLGYLPPDVGVPNRYSRAPGASRGSAQGGGGTTTETATFFTLPRSRIPPCWTGLRVVRLEISDVFRVRPLGPTRGSTRARKGSQAGACSESQAQEARLVRGVTIKTRHFNTCWLTRHDEDLDRPAVDRLRIRVHRRVRHSDEHQ